MTEEAFVAVGNNYKPPFGQVHSVLVRLLRTCSRHIHSPIDFDIVDHKGIQGNLSIELNLVRGPRIVVLDRGLNPQTQHWVVVDKLVVGLEMILLERMGFVEIEVGWRVEAVELPGTNVAVDSGLVVEVPRSPEAETILLSLPL